MRPVLPQPGDYGIVIGVQDYPILGRPVPGAVKDAKWFYNWLVNDPQGGGVPKENCALILSTEDPVRPIHDDVDEGLERILNRIPNEGAARRFYFYFAGHGVTAGGGAPGRTHMVSADLCLAKYSATRRNMALSTEDYRELITSTGYFQEIVFFLDSCRTTQPGKGLHPTITDYGEPAPAHYLTIFAAEYGRKAFEGEVNDQGPVVFGHLTAALKEALEGAAASIEDGVPLNDLRAYVEGERGRVKEIADEHGHSQEAKCLTDFPQNNDVIFGSARKHDPRKRLRDIAFRLSRRLDPASVQLVQDGEILKSGFASNEWGTTLLPGLYQLRTRDDIHDFAVLPGEKEHIEFWE